MIALIDAGEETPISSGLSNGRLWTALFHPSVFETDCDVERDDEVPVEVPFVAERDFEVLSPY